MKLFLSAALVAALTVSAQAAFEIIDSFDDAVGQVAAATKAQPFSSSFKDHVNALGGTRYVSVEWTGPASAKKSGKVEVNAGELSLDFNSDASVSGTALVGWGYQQLPTAPVAPPSSLNKNFGSFTKFWIVGATDLDAKVTITVYTDANNYLTKMVNLQGTAYDYSAGAYVVDFASFAAHGTTASWTVVTGITLGIEGKKGTDAQINQFIVSDDGFTPVPEASTILAGIGAVAFFGIAGLKRRQ